MSAPLPVAGVLVADGEPSAAYRRLDLASGEYAGCAPVDGGLAVAVPQGTYAHLGQDYEYATWIAPPVAPGFGFRELIPSWAADTPAGTWIEVCVRVRPAGTRGYSRWFVAARWAAGPAKLPQQSDPAGYLDRDTFHAHTGRSGDAWQLRVTLLRPAGTSTTPVLRYAGAVASGPVPVRAPSRPGPHAGRLLPVPDGAASAVGAVLRYWGVSAPADGWGTSDISRSSAAAYAAGFGLDAFVTRLRDLTEAEEFLAAGVPLVLELADRRPVVLAGLDRDGRAAVHDQAGRALYERATLEADWLAGSGGVVLVIRPLPAQLPARRPDATR